MRKWTILFVVVFGLQATSVSARDWVAVGNEGWWVDVSNVRREGDIAHVEFTHYNRGLRGTPEGWRPGESPDHIFNYAINCRTRLAQFVSNGQVAGSFQLRGVLAADYLHHICAERNWLSAGDGYWIDTLGVVRDGDWAYFSNDWAAPPRTPGRQNKGTLRAFNCRDNGLATVLAGVLIGGSRMQAGPRVNRYAEILCR